MKAADTAPAMKIPEAIPNQAAARKNCLNIPPPVISREAYHDIFVAHKNVWPN
jgi:hypothetical protein